MNAPSGAPPPPTARLPHIDSDALLDAAAANHRCWFRRNALAVGGRVEAAVERIRGLRLREASCWSLTPDPALGTRLVARGFGWGGIYSMGVSPAHRRQGIGRALTIAACRVAAGFESLGWGATWWYRAGRRPTPRQAALAEAIGFGDRAALAALRPSAAELAQKLPGGTSPIRLALVTDRLATAGWMLERAPALLDPAAVG